ncbi:MAG: hypothetical protein K5945_11785 [Bacteroidaceae bacterium]|nr:hypothetical protein [Bacteroidaceae bacterium]
MKLTGFFGIKAAVVALMALAVLTGCRRQSRWERIEREARTFTAKECPFNVDDYTRMDSTTFDIDTKCYYYNYTVSGILDNDSIYNEELNENYRRKTLDEIRTSIQLRGYKEAGLTLVFRYYSAQSGRLLSEYRFSKEDYSK